MNSGFLCSIRYYRRSEMKVTKLKDRERMFLAGCIKNDIIADGTIDDEELKDLDVILKKLGFHDFDGMLETFEGTIKDEESFWELAESITSKDVQNIILEVLYELSIQDGLVAPGQKKLMEDLQAAWGIGDEK